MQARSAFAPLILSLVAVLASCTQGGASSTNSVAASLAPPFGLEGATLPSDASQVEALLRAMPSEIGGLTKKVSGDEAGYGDGGMGQMSGSMTTFLRVMDLGGAAANDYGTAAPFIRAMVDTGEIGNEGAVTGANGSLVWAAGTTPGDPGFSSIMWGAPGSRYVFLIQASSPGERQALIDGFIQAGTLITPGS